MLTKMLHEYSDDEIIREHRRRFSVCENKNYLHSSRLVKEYLKIHFHKLERDREHFLCIYLDGGNNIITVETLFTGSLTTSAVYPREVIKAILKHESSSVIFAHNHPSGSITPSGADRAVTKKLKIACESIDVDVLDHLIYGKDEFFSFADHKLI